MANKIIGYILLAMGLALIGWPLWQSYSIFSGKTAAPLVFQTPSANEASQNIQSQIEQAVQKQLGQALSPASITRLLNLASWSLMAFILISGGGAIAGIGAKLII